MFVYYKNVSEVPIGIKGPICEFGVYRGKSLISLGRKYPKRDVYGFDSFQGLPEDWNKAHPKGHFTTAGRVPHIKLDNVHIVKGIFKHTLPNFECGIVSLLHIDSDLYSSCVTVLKHMNNGIVKGTVLVFDEFNFPLNIDDDEEKAFEEWKKRYNRVCQLLGSCRSERGKAFIVIR